MIRKQALAIAESLLLEIEQRPFTLCVPGDRNAAATTAVLDATATDTAKCWDAVEAMGPEAGESRYSSSAPFNNVNDYQGFAMPNATCAGICPFGQRHADCRLGGIHGGSWCRSGRYRSGAGRQLGGTTDYRDRCRKWREHRAGRLSHALCAKCGAGEPMLRSGIRHQLGVTLIEMIVVIVVSGILISITGMFVRNQVEAYVDVARRAEMSDIADGVLRRIARDVQGSVPNSLRPTSSDSSFIELVPIVNAGRFASPGNGGSRQSFDIAGAGNFRRRQPGVGHLQHRACLG